MMPDEKTKLLALLENQDRWCRDAEARDGNGHAIRFADVDAVAWDITGALCWLFGWKRAYVLFEQIERHINGKRKPARWPSRDTGIEAMKALQVFNDQDDTTFDSLRERLEAMPVWSGVSRATKAPIAT